MAELPELPEHDESDELERAVAHDETVTVEERRAMLEALRRMRARTSGRTPGSP